MFAVLEGAFYNDFEECVVLLLFSIYVGFLFQCFYEWYVKESARLAALRAPTPPAPSAPANKTPIIPYALPQPDVCTVYPPPRTWPDLPPTFDRTFCLREPEKARQLGLPSRPSFGMGSNPLSNPSSSASYFTLPPTKPAQPSTSQRLNGGTRVWHGDHYRSKTTTEQHNVSIEQVPTSIEEVSIERPPLVNENTGQQAVVNQCERNVVVAAPECEHSLSREIEWVPEVSHWSQSTEAVNNQQEPTIVADASQEAANPATFDCSTLTEGIPAQRSQEPDHSTLNLTALTMSASSRAQMYCVLWYPKFSNVWLVHSAEWGPFQAFALYCHEQNRNLAWMNAQSHVYNPPPPPIDVTPSPPPQLPPPAPAAPIFSGLDSIISQCNTSTKKSSSKPEASKVVANDNFMKVTSYNQPYRPTTVSELPKQQKAAAISFQGLDWTISNDELFKLSKATWGWTDDTVWQHSEGKELLWPMKPTPNEETAACKNVDTVQERLDSKVIAFKRAAVMLRLQALAGNPPSGTTPRLLGQVTSFLLRVDQMLDKLNEESTLSFDKGDWRWFKDAVNFFKDYVLQKEYVVASLRDYYGKKAVGKLENTFNNLGGHFVIFAEVPE